MSKKKICPCCGAKMVEYKHGLSKSLLRAFALVVRQAHPKRRFSFKDCTSLTISQATNLQKLRYWNFIDKPEHDEEKGGEWIITEKALQFMMGNIAVSKYVWTYRGTTQRYEGERVMIDQITDGWKYRPDYAREAISHGEQGLLL